MSIEEDILDVEELLTKLRKNDREKFNQLRLFLITDNRWLRVYDGNMYGHADFIELGFIRTLKPDRGKILDFFSKLEVIANELIHAKLLGLFSMQGYVLDDILEYIDLNFRVKLLKKWGIIDRKLLGRITKIVSVRNQYAHRWDENEIFYGEKLENNKTTKLTIIENMKEFKEDAEFVWRGLIKKYEIEEKKHIGKLKTSLGDYNTTTAIEFSNNKSEV